MNVFVTVGTQLPFDRLVRCMDEWAGRHKQTDVVAQIGPSAYRPRHLRWQDFLDADQCRCLMGDADLIVAHAGMGSILTALELGRPIVVMPRRGDLREHRNDHQLATARHLQSREGVIVVHHEGDLLDRLERVDELRAASRIARSASRDLLEAIGRFVELGVPVCGVDSVAVGAADPVEMEAVTP